MATYDFRYIAEGRKYTFVGIGEVTNRFLERFPAAHLVGRGGELVAAHRRCAFEQPPPPWEATLVDPVCAALAGDPVDVTADAEATIREAVKYYAVVPRLCKTVADRDAAAFASTLEEYLSDGWGPLIETHKDRAEGEAARLFGEVEFPRDRPVSDMGGIPTISKKTEKYIPFDLVGS